ncbi:antigen UB05 [Plasmodium gaboni]|uniref:Antigen UB05 n=1 Tax=Plasmodium gaboni TaxID=647221 RepID=A0A151LL84_9APIC|nr:antigen UB05 [Plasmodium gaboni]KYN99750.1 antigen UB05 [Plasmodium gaboni]SOV15217.1 antigen UB05 [Plasmodium gaboni]SOV23109.1 antigen UB05 [Plasmodium sp. DRC-Itaito]
MASQIQPSRFLDSAIIALFAMIISASFLYMFSEFFMMSHESKLFNNKLSMILSRLFPFKTFEYNLTHILLLTICIIILSLKPESVSSKYGLKDSRKPQGKDDAHKADEDPNRLNRDKKK